MQTAQAEIISDIIEEHFDEATFLYQARLRALASHRIGLADFRRLEQRFIAHLDGLISAGEAAWPLIESALAGPTRATASIAAYVACERDDESYIEMLYSALRDAPPHVFWGIRDALCQARSRRTVESLSRWLYAAHFSLRAAAVDALSFRRAVIPTHALSELLSDHAALVRQHAAQAVGRLRLQSIGPQLQALFDDQDAGVRESALEAAILLNDQSAAERCRTLVKTQNPSARLAFTMLGRLGNPADLTEIFAPELARDDPAREAVLALGSFGYAQALPLLLPLAARRQYAGLVTVVVQQITGIDLESQKIAGPPPSPADARDELDEVAVEGLPICDPDKLTALVQRECARLSSSRRCLGQPHGAEALEALLVRGPMAQRIGAAFELALVLPSMPFRELQHFGT